MHQRVITASYLQKIDDILLDVSLDTIFFYIYISSFFMTLSIEIESLPVLSFCEVAASIALDAPVSVRSLHEATSSVSSTCMDGPSEILTTLGCFSSPSEP